MTENYQGGDFCLKKKVKTKIEKIGKLNQKSTPLCLKITAILGKFGQASNKSQTQVENAEFDWTI